MDRLLRAKSSAILIALALIIFGVAMGWVAFGADNKTSGDKGSAEEYMQAESVILNLNTITKEQLMEFDYIDGVIADRIIQYREENAGFKSIEELDKVSGVGEKRFRAIAPYVTIE